MVSYLIPKYHTKSGLGKTAANWEVGDMVSGQLEDALWMLKPPPPCPPHACSSLKTQPKQILIIEACFIHSKRFLEQVSWFGEKDLVYIPVLQ